MMLTLGSSPPLLAPTTAYPLILLRAPNSKEWILHGHERTPTLGNAAYTYRIGLGREGSWAQWICLVITHREIGHSDLFKDPGIQRISSHRTMVVPPVVAFSVRDNTRTASRQTDPSHGSPARPRPVARLGPPRPAARR